MHVIIKLGRFSGWTMEDGYEFFAQDSIYTQPDRMKIDVNNAIQSILETFIPTCDTERVGLISCDIAATDEECRKMMRTIAANHVLDSLFETVKELKSSGASEC